MEVVSESVRQLKLFKLENPLSTRLGDAFFRELPRSPGVYFFFGKEDELLYIGQSIDLRARVGSYRYVTLEKHPKRTRRLVQRTMRIAHRVCGTAKEAIELERMLLLEYRPPFNRAGVWKGDPWWLVAKEDTGRLTVELTREPQEGRMGPLPSGFRYVLASLVRCLYRVTYPSTPLGHYPHGLFDVTLPRPFSVKMTEAARAVAIIESVAQGGGGALIKILEGFPEAEVEAEQEYWAEEMERLVKFVSKSASREGLA